TVLSLMFAEGQRPTIDALSMLSMQRPDPMPFALTHYAPDGESWVELLASGLTYDCRGLAAGAPADDPGKGALLGLAEQPTGEAVALEPAPHLAEGRGMLPVVRTLAGLGAALAGLPGIQGVYWHPARCWMAAAYYRTVVGDWLGGGAFPALGLTSLQRERDGSMVTAGLDFLVGQELRFTPDRSVVPAAVARIAVRLIHGIVENGPLHASQEYEGPEGERVLAEPVMRGRYLRVTIRR
ncbi:MAG: hypothetical protein ACKOPG_08415, partial [Novosphingobium sp.]